MTSHSGTNPMRPARSRMREPPGGNAPRQHEDRPRPSEHQSYDTDSTTPHGPGPYSGYVPGPSQDVDRDGPSADPFEYDRSQRTQLRAQASAVAQRPYPTNGGETGRLKNVVGAFMSAGRSRDEPPVKRPPKSRARETMDQAAFEFSGDGEFGQMDAVLRRIHKEWPFVLESEFSPSTLALSLLSRKSSNGSTPQPSLQSFLRMHEALSASLQTSVQAHFQSFAASLPTHATFLTTLDRAQDQVVSSRQSLRDSRAGFAGKGKTELASVKIREKAVRDMLGMLDSM